MTNEQGMTGLVAGMGFRDASWLSHMAAVRGGINLGGMEATETVAPAPPPSLPHKGGTVYIGPIRPNHRASLGLDPRVTRPPLNACGSPIGPRVRPEGSPVFWKASTPIDASKVNRAHQGGGAGPVVVDKEYPRFALAVPTPSYSSRRADRLLQKPQCHSRESGNLVCWNRDSRFRGNDAAVGKAN